MMVSVSSDFSEDDNKKFGLILNTYSNFVREKAEKLGIFILNFPILRPHNRVIVVDKNNIHIVLSFKDATPGYRDEKIRDFRDGILSPESLLSACERELSYTQNYYFSFPSEFLTLPEEELKKRIDEIAEKEVKDVYLKSSI